MVSPESTFFKYLRSFIIEDSKNTFGIKGRITVDNRDVINSSHYAIKNHINTKISMHETIIILVEMAKILCLTARFTRLLRLEERKILKKIYESASQNVIGE